MNSSKTKKWPKIAMQLLLFALIIGGGLVFAKHYMDTRPVAKRSRPERQVPLVNIQPLQSTSKTVSINAMGTVVSSRQISLYPELTGTVVWVSPNFVPGGKVTEGEILVKLDRTDYELAVKKQESLIQQIQADLDLEKGQQAVARQEMELMQKTLGKTIKDPKLALRVPQMNKVLATLRSQQVNLDQARIDLERTIIRAPFSALILNRSVELGSRITGQTALATLTGTDAFWIETAIPVEKLRWIGIPGLNNTISGQVKVHLQDGSSASGTVLRLLGNLSDKSQMARILVSVNDPLSLDERRGQMPLLLNSYVSMDLTGATIRDVVEIPRSAVKDGNQIWIYQMNQLRIRTIEPVWEDTRNIYVRQSVSPGELLITSEMSTAVDGMAVRTGSPESDSTKIADNRKELKPGIQDRKPGMRPVESTPRQDKD